MLPDQPEEVRAHSVPSQPSESSVSTTSQSNQLQERLFQLRMKINQGRKANKDEVEEEYKRMVSNNTYSTSQEDDDHASPSRSRKNGKKNQLHQPHIMNQTAEEASWIAEKNRKKAETLSTFGLNSFTDDQYYRAYEKRLKKLPIHSGRDDTDDEEAKGDLSKSTLKSQSLTENPLEYGKINSSISDVALKKLSEDVLEREQQRKKYGKRRLHVDGDIDFINDKNAKFNRKLDRAFDKYTVEIRQNLERGTAV